MFDSIKKKINIRTLMGQSEALEENTTELKNNITNLVQLLKEKGSIISIKPIQRANTITPTSPEEIEQKKEQKKQGRLLDFLVPLLGLLSAIGPILAPLIGIGSVGLAFIINPETSTKYLTRNIFKNLFKFARSITKFFKNLIENIGKFFKKTFDFIGNTLKRVKNFFDDKILKPIKNTVDDLLSSKFVQNIKKAFTNIIDSVKNFIGRGIKSIREFFENIGTKVKNFIGELFEKTFDFTKKLIDNILNLSKPLVEKVRNFLIKPAQEFFEETTEKVLKSTSKNFDVVKQFFKQTTNNIVNKIYKTINDVQFNLKNNPILKNIPGYQTIIDRVFSPLKSMVKDPKGVIGKLIDTATNKFNNLLESGERLVETGKERGSKLLQSGIEIYQNVQSGLTQAIEKGKTMAFDIFENVQDFGGKISTKIGDIGKGVGESLKNIQPSEIIKNTIISVIGGIQNNVLKPVQNQVSKLASPLIEAATDPETYKRFFVGISNTLKPINNAIVKPIRNLKASFLKFMRKLPGGKSLMKGFKAATGRFDKLFALSDVLINYGMRIQNQENPNVNDMFKGENIGNALLRVLGGFGGSAIGSAVGTVGTPLLGFAGSVLGGVVGEEAGMLVTDSLSKNDKTKNLSDPFGMPIFSPVESEDSFIKSIFGMGGGTGVGRVTPVKLQRSMSDMEEYPEYDVETNIIILKQKNQQSQQMIGSQINNGNKRSLNVSVDTSLNTFRTVTISKLAYL